MFNAIDLSNVDGASNLMHPDTSPSRGLTLIAMFSLDFSRQSRILITCCEIPTARLSARKNSTSYTCRGLSLTCYGDAHELSLSPLRDSNKNRRLQRPGFHLGRHSRVDGKIRALGHVDGNFRVSIARHACRTSRKPTLFLSLNELVPSLNELVERNAYRLSSHHVKTNRGKLAT